MQYKYFLYKHITEEAWVCMKAIPLEKAYQNPDDSKTQMSKPKLWGWVLTLAKGISQLSMQLDRTEPMSDGNVVGYFEPRIGLPLRKP